MKMMKVLFRVLNWFIAVADFGLVAWGDAKNFKGEPRISRGRKFTNFVINRARQIESII